MEVVELLAKLQTLKSYKLYDYTLPLNLPLKERHGVICLLQLTEGELYAECSPLPGWHKERLIEARAQLIHFLEGPKERVDWDSLYPSVEFGLASACHHHLDRECFYELPIHALLCGEESSLLAHAKESYECGVRCFKLKLRPESGTLLRTLLAHLPSDTTFRLDGNRQWEWEETKEYFHALRGLPIEYIEDPFKKGSDLYRCYQETGLPYAWDETLINKEIPEYPTEGLAAIVMKPSLLGYNQTLKWITWSRIHGVDAILSHPYETGGNLTYLALMAHKHQLFGPHGFDSYHLLTHDVVEPSFFFTGGSIKGTGAITFKQKEESALGILSYKEAYTWEELFSQVKSVEKRFQERGFKKGERVAFYHHNRSEYVVCLLACWEYGLLPFLYSTRRPLEWVEAHAREMGCRVLLKDLSAFMSDLPLQRGGQELSFYHRLDQEGTVLFTSGSTGTPKAVLHTVGNHLYNAKGALEHLPFREGDRWLVSLPLYHVGGLSLLFRALHSKGTLVFPEDDSSLDEALLFFKCTHLSLVPTQLRRLLSCQRVVNHLQGMQMILVGGAPFPMDLLEEVRGLGLPVYPTYGLTEMSSQVCTAEKPLERQGKLLPYRELKIAEDGELLLRGKTLFKGYLTSEGLESPFVEDGWFPTKDLGVMDRQGKVTLLGRKDSVFISGGENIDPQEITQVLKEHIEAIEEIVVFPYSDHDFGMRPAACIRWKEGKELTEDLFIEQARSVLPGYMIPRKLMAWCELSAPYFSLNERS